MRKTSETNANAEITRFAYDASGNLTNLTDAKTQTTAWHYDMYGRVINKVDAASTVILAYQYDGDNRLTNRWSAAKGNTAYRYDHVGNFTNVVYPVSPSISMTYDALDRLTNMVDGVGTTKYCYDSVGQLLSEDGPWANDTVSYTYTDRLRTSMSLQQPNANPWLQSYGYDGAKRLTSTLSPAGYFGYVYDATARMQVKSLTLPNGAYITNTYDTVARQTSTILKNSGNTNLDAYTYGYDVGNRRTNVIRTQGDVVTYNYDAIGQLIKATAVEFGGVTNRLQEQFGYGYDAAHNLHLRTNNDLVQNFTVNSLNELSNATRNGTLTVAGTTMSQAATVTVSGDGLATGPAIRYNDQTWASSNTATPVDGNNTYTAIANDSLGRFSTNSVTAFLPATPTYTYDTNGNMLSDGTRQFTYDDENQLISAWVTNAWMSQFVYDGKMRRRITREFTWSGTTWTQTNEVHYIYDGNVVIQERDVNNLPSVAYTRGKDMSGSFQGAGGIGGLLARTDQTTINPALSTCFYHCDGNGNVTTLIDGLQFIEGRYLYDPYGNLLSMSGPMAAVNLHRFSSKEYHQKTGLIYYLFRFYDANVQRWLNRDPLVDIGHSLLLKHRFMMRDINIFEFVNNNPIEYLDQFGLQSVMVLMQCFNKSLPKDMQCQCLCAASMSETCIKDCEACNGIKASTACTCMLRARGYTNGTAKKACKALDKICKVPKPEEPEPPVP